MSILTHGYGSDDGLILSHGWGGGATIPGMAGIRSLIVRVLKFTNIDWRPGDIEVV